jgi:hypothetical protein
VDASSGRRKIMSFYTAQVVADERGATVARENALILAQHERGTAEIRPMRRWFSLARPFRRSPSRRPASTAPCPATSAMAPSGC